MKAKTVGELAESRGGWMTMFEHEGSHYFLGAYSGDNIFTCREFNSNLEVKLHRDASIKRLF